MQRNKWLAGPVWLVALGAIHIGSARAQKQTDVALSVYGAFSTSATPGNSNFIQDYPAASAGGMLEFRYIFNPSIGLEASYAFNRANQVYTEQVEYLAPGPSCVPNCPIPTYSVSADAHEFTADWVLSDHIPKHSGIRPFGLLGAGLLLVQPMGSQGNTANSTQPAFVYGVGLDWGFTKRIGLRLQYRGNLYKAPGIVPPNNTNPKIGFMHTAEPALGVFYKF